VRHTGVLLRCACLLISPRVSANLVPEVRAIFDRVDENGSQLGPVQVQLCPLNKLISIIDGASALGYLFSVVQPPRGIKTTSHEYFLPMLVLYSQCLYLVFAKHHQGNISNLQGVPVMASVMYLADDVPKSDTPFLFGASLACDIVDDHFKVRRVTACTWRRDNLLLPALQASGQPTPPWLPWADNPIYLRKLVAKLHALILGSKTVTDKSDPKYRLVEDLLY
jgi:hypothetical protein